MGWVSRRLQQPGEQRGRGLEPGKSGHVFFFWTNCLFSANSVVGRAAPSVKPCQMWWRDGAKKERKKRENEKAWKRSSLKITLQNKQFRAFFPNYVFLLTFACLIMHFLKGFGEADLKC